MYENKMVINDKSENLLSNGTFSKGDNFQITHCDGYVANEKIDYIVRHVWDEFQLITHVYRQKKMDVIVCESGACYDAKDLN